MPFIPLVLAASQVAASPIPADEARACVNLGNGLDAPSEGAWGYVIQPQHLDAIAGAGFDLVRLPVRWSAHAGTEAPYTVDPAFLARVREVAEMATARGLGVVVDMHHYDEAMDAPRTHEKRIVAIWTQVAAAYADLPQSVAFEVFNEPHGKYTKRRVARLNRKVLAAIRQENPDRQVVVGGEPWNALWALDGFIPPTDDNIAVTFHYYEPFAFTHQGAPWVENAPPTGRRLDPDADGPVLAVGERRIAAAKARLDRPLFLGEFGAYRPGTDPADRMAYMTVVRQIAERRGVTWCVWNFASNFGIYDVEAETFLPGALTALGLDGEE